MSITIMFMVLATLTPFLFLRLNKKLYALIQSVLLVGMWLYFFAVMFQTPPDPFSISWIMFYLSLIVAEVAWVMFIIYEVKFMSYRKRNLQ
ncbi:hypothetical protein KFZ58_15950 [Virgibacillus sp. NKC19-16]|uniref:hypothetical protein n=1 Tax=Virgibacillus salidurans TaxID=2831673 RepID=UPI001F3D8F93|nr:hypothetical protein [Virgibacillus sp. NKC19-16]UJL45855.1 hypothetical protein KFZ58_15950 [Virgibacillus sp. NKC19-16]